MCPAVKDPDSGAQWMGYSRGVYVFRDPLRRWMASRPIWNQHAYHITNVNIDGTLPWPEPNSWAGDQSNTYRQNIQGRGMFSSPDLSACEVTVDLTNCRGGKAVVSAAVYNGGATPAIPGATVCR